MLEKCEDERNRNAQRRLVREMCETMLAEGAGSKVPALTGFMVELLQQENIHLNLQDTLQAQTEKSYICYQKL